jgi:fibronectin-binding autotransporter adhesin
MLKRKAKQRALLAVATLPVVTMLCAARPARADTYWYPSTSNVWNNGDWYDTSTLTLKATPPGDGVSVAIIGDFNIDLVGPININVAYNYSYGATGIGALDIDSGNTLTQSANYAMVSGTENLGYDGTGNYTQSAGSNTFSNNLILGYKAGSQNAGTYTLSGGTLTGSGTAEESIGVYGYGTLVQSGGSNISGGAVYVGSIFSANTSAVGNYQLSGTGSTLSAPSELIGDYSTGAFYQYNGTTNTTGSVAVLCSTTGNSAYYGLLGGILNSSQVSVGTNGTFDQEGGTLNYSSFSQTAGRSFFATGFLDIVSGQTATVSGGTFNASDVVVSTGASFTQTGGTLSVSAFNQNGGTVSLSSGIDLSATSYNLAGGTLSLPSFSRSASANQLTWTGGSLTLTSQALDVTSATSDSFYGGYIYGSSLTLGNGMTLNTTGGAYPQENIYGSGSSITQQTGSSNTTTNLYLGSTGSSAAEYVIGGGALTVTGNAYVGNNLNEGGSGFSGLVYQYGGTAQYGSLTLGTDGTGTYQLLGGSATVTNTTNLDTGASLQIQGGSFTTGSFFGPGSDLLFTGGTLTLTGQDLDVTSTTTDPSYKGFVYGSTLTLNSGMTFSGGSNQLNVFGSGSIINQATGSSLTTDYLLMGDSGTGATPVIYNLSGGSLTVMALAEVGASLYSGQNSATFNQSGGTSSFRMLSIGSSGTGSVTLSGGTMTASSAVDLDNGSFHQSGGTLSTPVFSQSGGTANFDNGFSLSSSSYKLTGGSLTTSSFTGPGSNLNWTKGSLTLSNQAFEVTTATTDTALNGFIYGSTLTLNSGMSLTVPNSGIYPEEFVYGSGSSVTQNTGSTNSTDELLLGSTGTGSPTAVQYTLNGGTLTAGVTILGYNGIYTGPAAANFTQTGGTFTSGTTDIGQSGVSTSSLSGGTASLGNLYVGESTGGNGTLTISGGAAVTASALTIGYGTGNSAGVVNLGTGATGGSLTVASITGGSSTGGKTFYFDGGTLVASGNSTAFISGLSSAFMSDGGGYINNNGHTITIGQPLLHAGNGATDGGLTSLGTGTLTLSGNNTFNGGLTIQSGEVQLANAGALNSTTPNTVTFGAGSTGTLALNGNSVTISGLSTNATPGTPVVENANSTAATLTINNTGANTFAGVIQDGGGGGALSLIKNGAGTLTLSGSLANTYSGATTVTGGTLTLAAGGALATSSLNVSGSGSIANINGTLNVAPNTTVSNFGIVNFGAYTGSLISTRNLVSLNLSTNAKVNLLASSSAADRTLFETSSLTFPAIFNASTPTLDLSDNDMIVRNGNLSQIQALVDNGYNNGAENGSGIITSTGKTAARALGVLLNSNGTGGNVYTTFDGQPVNSTDVLVKYTLFGDTDLSGTVDIADLGTVALNYGRTSGATWSEGDFNGDGKVDISDLGTIALNYGDSLSSSVAPAEQSAMFQQALATVEAEDPAFAAALTGQSVPEPAMGMVVLAVAMLGGVRRRRGG